jgi:hypothetical protein
MKQVVYVRATKAQVHAALGKVAGIAAGTLADATHLQRAMLIRVAMTAQSRIRRAFVVKSGGGTDETGEKWAPLAPITVAHRNYKKAKKNRRISFDMFLRQVQADQSIVTRYSKPDVMILRDRGLLLNSLSPAVQPGVGATTMPTTSGQVFRLLKGEVQVGTRIKGAKDNHDGKPAENLPQRRLWPSPRNWTQAWWTDMLEQGRAGVVDIIVWLMKGLP